MDNANNQKNDIADALDSKVKGVRLSSVTRKMYEQMKEVAGGTDDTFIEHLLQISKLHDLQKTDPEFADELKELQKYLSRFSSVYIRLRERGADALEDTKERSQETISRLEQDLENMQIELSNLLKRLAQKDEELASSKNTNSEYLERMKQFEKTSLTLEELNRLTGEKLEQMEKRVNELVHAEVELTTVKMQHQEEQQKHEKELADQKEVEKDLRRQLEEQLKEMERREKDAAEAAVRVQKDHERALEVMSKDKDIEARETLLREKNKMQDEMAQLRNQLSEQHAVKLAELVERIQKNQKEEH